MQTMIWAISSMVVLMLISFFIPIGYSLKGKVLVVITSFLLSLVGLLALKILPIWETGLITFALICIATYLMNSRMEPFIIKADKEVYGINAEIVVAQHQLSQSSTGIKDDILLELNKEALLPIATNFNLENDLLADSNSSLKMNDLLEIDRESEIINLDNPIMFPPENYENKEIELDKPEEDYLSEIESLIEIENEFKQEEKLEDVEDLQPLNLEEKIPLQNEEPDNQLDDSLFDFLLAEKEVAVELEDSTKEKISIQK
ncbi:hypothetical protein [Bacillus sp. USDA818B3_A]|uniref:hypothetical protein n=1 Tax=Bacillus sp. USDA818B3_A TaxID=2698834 RepID=UPI00136EF04B|nr:hypothetical protein [Bacillus sp. USDA818B3_A]